MTFRSNCIPDESTLTLCWSLRARNPLHSIGRRRPFNWRVYTRGAARFVRKNFEPPLFYIFSARLCVSFLSSRRLAAAGSLATTSRHVQYYYHTITCPNYYYILMLPTTRLIARQFFSATDANVFESGVHNNYDCCLHYYFILSYFIYHWSCILFYNFNITLLSQGPDVFPEIFTDRNSQVTRERNVDRDLYYIIRTSYRSHKSTWEWRHQRTSVSIVVNR